MKIFATILSYTLRFFYVLLLLIFSFSLSRIIEHEPNFDRVNSTEAQTSNEVHEYTLLVNYVPTKSGTTLNGSSALAFTRDWSLCGVLCALSFLLLYIGFPVYNLVSLKRPIQRINSHFAMGEPKELQSAWLRPELKQLHQTAKSTLRFKESTLKILDNINGGNLDQISVGDVDESLKTLHHRLLEIAEGEKASLRINSNVEQLEHILKAEADWQTQTTNLITFLTKSTKGGVGVIYEWKSEADENFFSRVGSYGFYDNRKCDKIITANHGQLGQIAASHEMILLENVPAKYLTIHSGLGSAPATVIVIAPLLFNGNLYGAVEIGFFAKPLSTDMKWLERACESIAAHFFSHRKNMDAKYQLEALAHRQAAELIDIHSLQRQTYHELESKLVEMQEQKRKSEIILEGCVDGVLVFDANGTIDFCNVAAAEILGETREHILSQTVSSLFPVSIIGNDRQWKVMRSTPVPEREISVRTEVTLPLRNKNEIDLLITCTTANLKSGMIFTFFIQKISADLF
jgi:PAS domain-containing protein